MFKLLLLLSAVHSAAAYEPCADLPQCLCHPVTGPAVNVTTLICEDKSLQNLPATLHLHPRLKDLDFDRNQISELASDAFASNTALEKVALGRNALTAFPSEALKPLKNLRVLDLDDNPFDQPTVPIDALRHMPMLIELKLRTRSNHRPGGSAGEAQGLALTASHLQNQTLLENIVIDRNPLTGADFETWAVAEAKIFQHLKYVSADTVNLTRIPSFIAGLTRLESLAFDFNIIVEIPPGAIPNSVQSLSLSLNQISVIKNGAMPTSVTILDLLANPIREIDLEVFSSLPNLKQLESSAGTGFSQCQLVNGTVSCDCADGLHRSLRGDACTVCPEHVPGFPDSPCSSALEGSTCTVRCGGAFGLDLKGTSATYTCGHDGRWSFTDGSEDLNCNNIICGTAEPPCNCVGTRVDCSRRNLTMIPSGFDVDTTEIDLSHNAISAVPYRSFEGLSELVGIDLSHNRISVLVDEAFADLRPLNRLDLSHNAITGLVGLPFPTSYNVEMLDLRSDAIRFVEEASALSRPMENLRDRVWGSRQSGTDTNMLLMDGNPLQCRYVVYAASGYAHGLVECDCTALNTTQLPFCPRHADEFRFQCDPGDNNANVPSLAVCDGNVDCSPSGIDEAVCEGTMVSLSSSPVCLLASVTCSDRGYSCFEMLRLSVERGVVTGRSNVPCDQDRCPPFRALLTKREGLAGAGERITYDQQGTLVSTDLTLDIGGTDTPSVPCEYEYQITSGMPAGITNPPTTTTESTTEPVDTTEAVSASDTPSWTPAVSTATSPQRRGSGSALSMSDQVTIVAIVCVMLSLVLVLVATFLYYRRSSQIRLVDAWLRPGHERI